MTVHQESVQPMADEYYKVTIEKLIQYDRDSLDRLFHQSLISLNSRTLNQRTFISIPLRTA